MRWQAVIFDLDGTLLETERLVITAGMRALGDMGLPQKRETLQSLVGTVGDDTADMLRATYGADFDMALYDRIWTAHFNALLAQGIPLRPGVRDLLDHLQAIGMPYAIATNSRTEGATHHLDLAGILPYFAPAHIHGRDQVENPKPAPDLFLLAAAGLGIAPQDCLAFEDSGPGAAAAYAAGMTVVMVPDQRAPGFDKAHIIADSLLSGAKAARLME